VLKLSNSSFFGFKGHIKTLDRAINILGTKTVRNIAVTTLLFAHTNKVRLWNLDIMNFWLHTFLVADITRELSQKVGLDGDESYIAGLLHDIGKLVLYAQRQDKADVFRNVHTADDIYTYEEKTWGITSTELSKLLLNKWNIPEEIVTGISEHRDFSSQSKLAKVVHVANEFASIVTDGNYKSSMSYPIFLKLLKDFSLSEIEFNRFSNMIPDIVERGKMIMKVMSKKHGAPPIRRRMITRATLITPFEYSLSKCLLELVGFSVETFTPDEVDAYQDFLKAEEELRKLEYDDRFKTNLDLNKSLEEEKLEEKKAGLFSRLFGGKKKVVEEESEEEPEEPKVKAINWNPLVVFELTPPVEIDRASVTSYQVLRDPSQISGTPIPFFFANPDIKTK
jgi:HD-like signal output (HDOD) protein